MIKFRLQFKKQRIACAVIARHFNFVPVQPGRGGDTTSCKNSREGKYRGFSALIDKPTVVLLLNLQSFQPLVLGLIRSLYDFDCTVFGQSIFEPFAEHEIIRTDHLDFCVVRARFTSGANHVEQNVPIAVMVLTELGYDFGHGCAHCSDKFARMLEPARCPSRSKLFILETISSCIEGLFKKSAPCSRTRSSGRPMPSSVRRAWLNLSSGLKSFT